ncbi:MAG: hypothetical protein ABIF19_05335 [Planctomycetota bacterium]
MSDNKTNSQTWRSVVAIAKENGVLKGVELQRRNGSFEILWAKSHEGADSGWAVFSGDCGLPAEPKPQAETEIDRIVVVGFNSAGTVFLRTNVPAVEDDEMASIVQLQAETRLPLPAEQIELAWRAGQVRKGQVAITMAASRREHLRAFVDNVRCLQPRKILLDCEGIVKAWRAVFCGTEKDALVLSAGLRNTQVCLVEDGRLSNAVVLDMGMEDFSAAGSDEQTETSERFSQDMISVLNLFGYTEQAETPVFVLSDNNPLHVSIVSSLRLAGLNARLAVPDVNKLAAQSELGVERIYEYRVPIGLALMGFDAGDDELNIFERLYSPTGEEEKKHWLYSRKITCAIAAVMLALLTIVSYAVDVASPKAIENRLKATVSDVDMDMLVERQQLIKTIARERPDLLDLLKLVNESGEKGITLNSLYFKKGQMVTVTGQTSGNDQLSKFEKALQGKKGVEKVNCTANTDAKTKKITFTMTFHYKTFTKKTTK